MASVICGVPGCTSNGTDDSKPVVFYPLPKDDAKAALWLGRIPRDWKAEGIKNPLTGINRKSFFVCSKHFVAGKSDNPANIDYAPSVFNVDGKVPRKTPQHRKILPKAIPFYESVLLTQAPVASPSQAPEDTTYEAPVIPEDTTCTAELLVMTHRDEVGAPLEYICKLCSESFNTLQECNTHVTTEHASPNSVINCDFLGSYLIMRPESYKVLPYEFPKIPCNLCDEKFKTTEEKNRHLNTSHVYEAQLIDTSPNKQTENAFFPCVECHKVILGEAAFEEHQAEHMLKKVCRYCRKKFPSLVELNSHHREAHEQEDYKYHCKHCPEMFDDSTSRKRHELRHPESHSYLCQYCGMRFNREFRMHDHERIHTGERNHVCLVCGFAFYKVSQLTKHMERHDNIRKYKCNYCDKKFFSTSEINQHERIHTGEMPYSCRFCYKGFKTVGNCTNHEKKHHPEMLDYIELAPDEVLDLPPKRKKRIEPSSLRYRCHLCSQRFDKKLLRERHEALEHGVNHEDKRKKKVTKNDTTNQEASKNSTQDETIPETSSPFVPKTVSRPVDKKPNILAPNSTILTINNPANKPGVNYSTQKNVIQRGATNTLKRISPGSLQTGLNKSPNNVVYLIPVSGTNVGAPTANSSAVSQQFMSEEDVTAVKYLEYHVFNDDTGIANEICL